ncbi:MAG: hypothetical protein ACYCYR_02395 [Desulfobulbaceae bacterium]
MNGENSLQKGYIACRTTAHFPLSKRIEAIPGSEIARRLEEGTAKKNR